MKPEEELEKPGEIEIDDQMAGDGFLSMEDFTLEKMIEYIFPVYGKARFYDIRNDKYLTSSDLQYAAGYEIFKKYIESAEKKVVDDKNIVFDPGLKDVPQGIINTYKGLSIKPVDNDCSLIIESLKHLCGNDKRVLHHVLCWLAFPLQNPGAKHAHALVFTGPGGSGKNLTFSVMLIIYGVYSTIINADQFGSTFNGFIRRRLFILVNEAIAQKHLFEFDSKLKNVITESIININEKNQPLVQEKNNVNLIFFSNKYTPVVADSDDRRFMVILTPPPREKAFYARLGEQIENGGAEGFLNYLLNYDVGDFNEYTEPLSTVAKQELIELTMKSDEKFVEYWLSGQLNIEPRPCLTDDLYKLYRKWCKHEGEKFAVSNTEFGIRLGRTEDVQKEKYQHYYNGNRKVKGTFVFPAGCEQPENEKKAEWLTRCRREFLKQAENWSIDNGDGA